MDSMMEGKDMTQIQGEEEPSVVVEQTHDTHHLSCITRSEEDDDSLAWFDPVDFSRETWTSIIYERIDPPLGTLVLLVSQLDCPVLLLSRVF
jgi:hypothetical protein